MDSPASHAVVLVMAIAAALGAAIATRRGPKDPPPSGRAILKVIWPFGVFALLEMLSLCTSRLIEQWLFPGLAAVVVLMVSRRPKVVKTVCRLLVATACVLWIHGHYLVHLGYVDRPSYVPPDRRAERRWYTPLTGLRPLVVTKKIEGP